MTIAFLTILLQLLMPVTAYGSLCRSRLTAPYAGHGISMLQLFYYNGLINPPNSNGFIFLNNVIIDLTVKTVPSNAII